MHVHINEKRVVSSLIQDLFLAFLLGILYEIVNGQNFQIQAMYDYLDAKRCTWLMPFHYECGRVSPLTCALSLVEI